MKTRTIAIAVLLFSGAMIYGQQVTKITKPDGKITSQYQPSNPKQSLTELIDGNLNTKYYQIYKTALWVQYECAEPAVVNQYIIASGGDMPDRDPKDWTLKASVDGVKWDDLDVQKDQLFPTRKTERIFKITNKNAYKFYRLDITANNGGSSGIQMAEWSLNLVK
ncbi:MAG: discoidin domain-containing protein [Paludibacter sp.]